MLPLLLLSGCAAMVRTWSYSTQAVHATKVSLEPREVQVRQDTIVVDAWLRSNADAPLTVDLGRARLEGLDLDVEGRALLTDEAGPLAWLGLGGTDATTLAPHSTTEVRVVFRVVGRDLRRLPRYRVSLPDLRVDGAEVSLQPLLLAAPAEAPMGEHI